jgi:hypothetical protein
MKKVFKYIAIAYLVALIIGLVYASVIAFNGNYLANAGIFQTSLLFISVCLIIVFLLWAIKFVNKIIPFVLLVVVLSGCSFSKSNQQVLISTDCGMTWGKISAGDAVPTGATNPCFMKVVIPNFPMQGETKFVSNLKDRVRAVVHIDYDYSIEDALAFIKQAKYLGNTNSSVDDESNSNTNFEQAENIVIDKRLKDVVKDILLEEDIVELDQNDLENSIHDKTNKVLKSFGVQLNFITLTFDLDEQTRQAIDVATAMKIYDSKNLGDIGKQVIVSRAGATKINIEKEKSAATTEQ